MNLFNPQFRVACSTIVGGVVGLMIGVALFHMPFGMGGSDFPILVCGLIGAGLGCWWSWRTPQDEEDAAAANDVLRRLAEQDARRRRGQPILPVPANQHYTLGLPYRLGRVCGEALRLAHQCAFRPHPFFRVACCALGGALLGHLIHATFAGGTLGVLPRGFDLGFALWTMCGALSGAAWGEWANRDVPVARCEKSGHVENVPHGPTSS